MITYVGPKKPDLRPPVGGYERLVNAHQKSLIRAYDTWSTEVRRRLLVADVRGATPGERKLILDGATGSLQAALKEIGYRGITAATRAAVGATIASTVPSVKGMARNLIMLNNQNVQAKLIPSIAEDLASKMLAMPAIEARPLFDIFVTMRSRVASQAGTAWNAVFQIQQTYGIQREQERKVAGEAIEPIRWVLDPLAVHCIASPERYGCPDLAGEYASWRDLPTVPAGRVSCFGNCVLPGQLVSFIGLQAAFRSSYSGPMLVFATKKGFELTVTPNHPILTDRGWVPAKFLSEGSNVFSSPVGKSVSQSVNDDNDNVPSLIEQVWAALSVRAANGRLSSSFVAMPHDFHGDGRHMNGEVNIIGADGHLSGDRETIRFQHDQNLCFGGRSLTTRSLSSQGTSMQVLDRPLPPTDSFMVRSNLPKSLFGRHSSPLDSLSLGLATNMNSVPIQFESEGTSGNTQFLSESIFGLPTGISLDEIVQVRNFDYTGHVYDLQCVNSLYNCNGVIVHNCRCHLEVFRNGQWRRGFGDI